jgi:UV DNA damage endonuclease
MILHLGGTFGDKEATIDRFRENYQSLSKSIQNRLVLENDDVSWSVHDLLPLCEELNIPLVLDFHHHNIIFDSSQVREGTQDIISLYPRIKATWDRKQMRQKMHYSEATAPAVTGRERRKHNARPLTLPPCANDMDLMIEAKDKEQAVFELMRTFKLPGWNTFNNIIPYEREDDNRPEVKKAKTKKTKVQIAMEVKEFGKEISEDVEEVKAVVLEQDIGMGGLENRVYWPIGMEEWLRPKKREVKKKDGIKEAGVDDLSIPTPHNFVARMQLKNAAATKISDDIKKRLADIDTVGGIQILLDEINISLSKTKDPMSGNEGKKRKPANKRVPARKKAALSTKNTAGNEPAYSMSDIEEEEEEEGEEEGLNLSDLSSKEDVYIPVTKSAKKIPERASKRASTKKVSYLDAEGSEMEI